MYKKDEKLYTYQHICIEMSRYYIYTQRMFCLIKLALLPIIFLNIPAKPMVLVAMLKSCGFFMSAICLHENEIRQ